MYRAAHSFWTLYALHITYVRLCRLRFLLLQLQNVSLHSKLSSHPRAVTTQSIVKGDRPTDIRGSKTFVRLSILHLVSLINKQLHEAPSCE